MNGVISPDEEPSDEEYVQEAPINYTKLSTNALTVRRREINDRLVDLGQPRPLLTGENPTSDEARDLHSQYFAINFALLKRGIEVDD